eukprot:tig00021105_g18259.t1
MGSLENLLEQMDPFEPRRLELRQRREQVEFEISRKLELEGRISVARVEFNARKESVRGKQAMSKNTQLKLQRSSVEHFKARARRQGCRSLDRC